MPATWVKMPYSFEDNMIKLLVNKTKLTSLLAKTRAFIL